MSEKNKATKELKSGVIYKDMICLTSHDLGTLAICAIWYCHGRQTYMPSLVRDTLRPLLPYLNNKDLAVMIDDCRIQASMDLYGDERIDKPGWVKWEQELLEEKNRREGADGTST